MSTNFKVRVSEVGIRKSVEIVIYLILVIPLLILSIKNAAGIYQWFVKVYSNPINFNLNGISGTFCVMKYCFLSLMSFSLASLFIYWAVDCYLSEEIEYYWFNDYLKKMGKLITSAVANIIGAFFGSLCVNLSIAIAYNLIKGYSIVNFNEHAWYVHLITGCIYTLPLGLSGIFFLWVGCYLPLMMTLGSLDDK